MKVVAFYRNVNLGQRGSPTRAELEGALAEAGASHPQSFQTNGTAVFEAGSLREARAIEARAGAIMRAACGLKEPAFTIEFEPLARLVAEAPFAGAGEATELAATFMADESLARLSAPFASPQGDVAVIRVTPFVALSVCRRQGTGPGYPTPFFEKLLGAPVTTRGWGTIERLAARHSAGKS